MRRITRRERAQVRCLCHPYYGRPMSFGRRLAEYRLYAARYGWWK